MTRTSLDFRSTRRKSFLSANRLQLPEVSLVADPLAGFGFALFSERFLFRSH